MGDVGLDGGRKGIGKKEMAWWDWCGESGREGGQRWVGRVSGEVGEWVLARNGWDVGEEGGGDGGGARGLGWRR